MKKKNLKKIIVAGAIATALCGTNVMAARYTGYVLSPRQGNNYTSAHTKKTNAGYITNHVYNLENTDTVTFWAANRSHKQISPDYKQKKGSTVNIQFTTGGYARKGTQVVLGMENSYFYIRERAFVSGDVNYR